MALPPLVVDTYVGRGLGRVRRALTRGEWTRVGGMVLTIVLLNVAGWGLLALALQGRHQLGGTQAFGFGTGVLAYTLGIRHAFDADHLAAIDNTTRKLIHDGRRPLSVGYFFSLGHSTVVFVLAVLLNFGVRWLNGAVRNGGSSLHHWTGIIGTTVSGTFLCLIGVVNLVVLLSIVRVSREMRRGGYDEAELERELEKRGFMNRILGGYARRIDSPGRMYPVGVLFGLGFDTATEVALLVLAGSAVVSGLPFYAVLSLPILFAAGMCLFDTLDGCFMNFAYDWAFADPIRKVYYNLTITGLSVFIALFIGSIEILGLVAAQTDLSGPFWTFVETFNINRAGFLIAGIFVAVWIVALAIWRVGGLEAKWRLQVAEAAGAGPGRWEPVEGRPREE